MTKGNLVATSMVGAIPAGALAYLTIMAFMHFADKMATMLQVVTGTALVLSVLMAVAPLAILLFMKSPGAADATEKNAPAAAVAGAAAAAAHEPAASDDAIEEDVLAAEGSGTDDAEMSLSGFDESAEPTSAADDSAFEFDDEAFEFEDDEQA